MPNFLRATTFNRRNAPQYAVKTSCTSRSLDHNYDHSSDKVSISDFSYFSTKAENKLSEMARNITLKLISIEGQKHLITESYSQIPIQRRSQRDLSKLRQGLSELQKQHDSLLERRVELKELANHFCTENNSTSEKSCIPSLRKLLKTLDDAILLSDNDQDRNFFELLKHPFKFQLFEAVFQDVSMRILSEEKAIHNRMGAGRELKKKTNASINTFPTVVSMDTSVSRNNIISPNNAFISINPRDLNIAVGGGEAVLGHGGIKLRLGQETLTGHESLKRLSRELTWQKIDMNMKVLAPGVLDTTTQDFIRKTYALAPELEKKLLDNHSSALQIPRTEWNYPFLLLTKHRGFGAYGKALNGVISSEAFTDKQSGMAYYFGDTLFNYLMSKNNAIISKEAQKYLKGSVWSQISPHKSSARQVDQHLDRLLKDLYIAQSDKYALENAQKALIDFKSTIKHSLNQQVRDLTDYYQLLQKADQLPPKTLEHKTVLKEIAKKEQKLGVKGRAEYIKKSTFSFVKSIQIYKRSCFDTNITEQDQDSFLQEIIKSKSQLYNNPDIYLTQEQTKDGLHAVEATPIAWHRKQVSFFFDLKELNLPGSIELKTTVHFVSCWGVPELEGGYLEPSLIVNANIPIGNIAQVSSYLAGKLINSCQKKIAPYHVDALKSSIQDIFLMLDTNKIPLQYGMRIETLLEDTLHKPSYDQVKKQRFQKYFTRILTLSGNRIGGSLPIPGVLSAGGSVETNDLLVHKEFLGTSTMNYLWRHFSGFLNAQDMEAWKNFCSMNHKDLKQLFKNIAKPDHPIQESYHVFLDKIKVYTQYMDKSTESPFQTKIAAFEHAASQLAQSDHDEDLSHAIQAYENLFTMYWDEVWKKQLMATKNKLGTGNSHFPS